MFEIIRNASMYVPHARAKRPGRLKSGSSKNRIVDATTPAAPGIGSPMK